MNIETINSETSVSIFENKTNHRQREFTNMNFKQLLALVLFTSSGFCLFLVVNCDSIIQIKQATNFVAELSKQRSKINKREIDSKFIGKSNSFHQHQHQHHVNRKQLDEHIDERIKVENIDHVQWDPFIGEPLSRQQRGPQNGELFRSKRGTYGYAPGGRSKSPKVQLAQRPPKSTTTSTTTTTTTTTTLSPSKAEATEAREEYDESEASGDYEEIERSDGTRQKTTGSAEAGNEEEEEEQPEEPATSTSTTTTTTTARTITTTTTQRASTKSPRRGDKSSGKKGARKDDSGGPAKQLQQQTNSSNKKLDEIKKVESSATEPQPSFVSSDKETEQQEVSNNNSNNNNNNTTSLQHHHKRRKPLVTLPFIKPKNASVCIPEAYLEFPRDLIGDKWRSRGLILIHIAVVCYMFYSLALVCERYFMPSLEEFAQRLNLSEDVAGATLMSAGSSAPELFTAILGVFVAKGDVGTGTIVGSAVFNILFVIGVCAFVSTTSAQLQWWPVLRDSTYYAFTVLVLILFIYDERVTALESFTMIALYGLYILIMANNEALKERVTKFLLSYQITEKLLSSNVVAADGSDDVFGNSVSGNPINSNGRRQHQCCQTTSMTNQQEQKTVEDDSMYLAALLVIVKHKRLFRSNLRFQSAARYVIVKRQHRIQQQQQRAQTLESAKRSEEVNYFGPESEPLRVHSSGQRAKMEAYAKSSSLSKQKFSIVSKDDYEFWNRPPEEGENYYLWLAKIPVNYVLHYTIPDCTLYPDKYLITFVVSILWTALFSYTMVWMVTLIGYTFGIPDSVMGATFLAAGTSIPDCYSSVHAARNGMADMAVSNSIGSNVFDILIGLSLPWFIQTAIYPGVVATINSRGIIYSTILLFLSLIVTIYLLNKYEWSLKPRLGLALLIAYGLFIVLTCMLEFNLFGHVNPPSCPVK